jgi:hypothetical protein
MIKSFPEKTYLEFRRNDPSIAVPLTHVAVSNSCSAVFISRRFINSFDKEFENPFFRIC